MQSFSVIYPNLQDSRLAPGREAETESRASIYLSVVADEDALAAIRTSYSPVFHIEDFVPTGSALDLGAAEHGALVRAALGRALEGLTYDGMQLGPELVAPTFDLVHRAQCFGAALKASFGLCKGDLGVVVPCPTVKPWMKEGLATFSRFLRGDGGSPVKPATFPRHASTTTFEINPPDFDFDGFNDSGTYWSDIELLDELDAPIFRAGPSRKPGILRTEMPIVESLRRKQAPLIDIVFGPRRDYGSDHFWPPRIHLKEPSDDARFCHTVENIVTAVRHVLQYTREANTSLDLHAVSLWIESPEYNSFTRLAVWRILALRHLFRKTQPRSVWVCDTASSPYRGTVESCIGQTAVVTSLRALVSASWRSRPSIDPRVSTLAYGRQAAKVWSARGISAQHSLVQLGAPSFDIIYDTKETGSEKDLCLSLGMPTRAAKIVVLTSRTMADQEDSWLDALTSWAIDSGNIVIIKPHPTRNVEYSGYLTGQAQSTPNMCITRSASSIDLILLSSVVISDTSTCAVEAVLCKRPLVQVSLRPLRLGEFDFSRLGVSRVARTVPEVIEEVRKALVEPMTVSPKSFDNFVKLFNRGGDGQAADRHSDFLLNPQRPTTDTTPENLILGEIAPRRQ